MKWTKYLLITVLLLSGLFQLLIGGWMLLDLESAGSMLLGISSGKDLTGSFEFSVLAKIGGKAFIMLFIYSILTCYLVFKNKRSAFIFAFSTGLMIGIIAVTTYLDTGSYMVWITDFSRGLLIMLFSLLFKLKGVER